MKGLLLLIQKAVELWEKSCAGGRALACNNLGAAYERGNGVNQSNREALTFYELACYFRDQDVCEDYVRLNTAGVK
ncbi:MAG: hypothetical protein O3A05_07140 [Proteobacteria bacterium]|nr:hypothetical protein [Pseudomonadota bacterium]